MDYRNKRLFVVFNKEEQSFQLFTAQTDAATEAKVSHDTIYRSVSKGKVYSNDSFIVGIANGINVNYKRSMRSKVNWRRLKGNE